MTSRSLYHVAQIRDIEHAAQAGQAAGTLMQRAAEAIVAAVLHALPTVKHARILIAAGPGNNGGDALLAAVGLAQFGADVFIVMPVSTDMSSADASAALVRAQNSDATFISLQEATASTGWQLVIDGLFGIGLVRPVQGSAQTLIAFINTLPCPVLAIDVPSGLDADTGCVIGADGIAVHASVTVTCIANKPGLHTASGRDFSGAVEVAELGIDRALFGSPAAELNAPVLFAQAAKKRPHASHKGSFGDLSVIGGASGMAGAVILTARMAAMAGAGRVFAGFAGPAPAYDSQSPELMCRSAESLDLSRGAAVAGPGLGMARLAVDLLAKVLSSNLPLVIDADALNLIAIEPGLEQKLANRRAASLLTPHPLEAARLLGLSSEAVQAHRLDAAKELAKRFNAVVILKGSGSIIAHPDGRLVINTSGNPALATAGSGDVLAGLCGALLAQHWPVWEAALAACWLHGTAADVLVAAGIGPAGLTASELIPAVRTEINRLNNYRSLG